MKPNGTTTPQGQKECGLVPVYNHITLMIIQYSKKKKKIIAMSLYSRYIF